MRPLLVKICAALLGGLVCLCSSMAAADAPALPEQRLQQTLYVNGAAAGDDGSGTEVAPFKTIAKALAVAHDNALSGTASKLLVSPGLYHERLSFVFDTLNDTLVTIEATEPGKTIISGSDVWTDWQPDNAGVYAKPWPYTWGMAPYPKGWETDVHLEPIVRRSEMVFVNGELMRQVLSRDQLKPGTFMAVEEQQKLLLYPPAGVDPATASIEVAVRPCLLRVTNKANMVLRGVSFTHACSPLQEMAVNFMGCDRVLVENCTFNLNNWSGLWIGKCSNFTARHNVANDNGGVGLSLWRSQHVLYEDNETCRNDWRGFRGGFDYWATGGVKMLFMRDTTFRRLLSRDNYTLGFWIDFDNQNVTIDDCRFIANKCAGLFIEASQGPTTVRNTVIALNHDVGIRSTNSQLVTLEGNTLFGNRDAQIRIAGQATRPVVKQETNHVQTLVMRDWRIINNAFVAADNKACLLETPGWDSFIGSLHSSGNLWFGGDPAQAVHFGDRWMDLPAWQEATGQDLDSIFADPRWEDAAALNFTCPADSPLHSRAQWPKRALISGGWDAFKQRRAQETTTANAEPFPDAAPAAAAAWLPLNLRPLVNRARTGPDGWMGALTLEGLPSGQVSFHGVPFAVIDPQPADGVSILALRSAKLTVSGGKPLPEQVVIPVNARVAAICMLHGCAYATKGGEIGHYQFDYADGSSQIVPIICLGDPGDQPEEYQRRKASAIIQDWWCTMPQFGNEQSREVTVVKPNDPCGSPRYLYTFRWINPHPEIPLKAIRAVSMPQQDSTLFVLAATALRVQPTAPANAAP